MEITLTPWNGNERLYFYRQSHQLAGQTGQIGKLRADFGLDGTAFFSTWEDIRSHLKTDEFRHDFDSVINTLRFDAEGTPLGSRKSLKAFLHMKMQDYRAMKTGTGFASTRNSIRTSYG